MIFLDDEWVTAVDDCLGALAPAGRGEPITIEYRVEGGPQGQRRHWIVLGPGGVRARRPGPDETAGATMTMTMSWEVAVAVNQGELSAQAAVLDGRILVSGDPVVLLTHQAALAAVDDVLSAVRTATVVPQPGDR